MNQLIALISLGNKRKTNCFRLVFLSILFSLTGNNLMANSMVDGVEPPAVQTTITGTVSDGTGAPLPGANVIVSGTTNGTQTDFD